MAKNAHTPCDKKQQKVTLRGQIQHDAVSAYVLVFTRMFIKIEGKLFCGGVEFGKRTRCHGSQTTSLSHYSYRQELSLKWKTSAMLTLTLFKSPTYRKQVLLEILLCILN